MSASHRTVRSSVLLSPPARLDHFRLLVTESLTDPHTPAPPPPLPPLPPEPYDDAFSPSLPFPPLPPPC